VFSARFAGEHGNDKKNNEKLLKLLQGKPKALRKAKFVSAIALVLDPSTIIKVQGEIEGYISEEEKGTREFGYDPLFYVPDYNMTFAEMSDELKNEISHRARALQKLKLQLKDMKL
jgi:XTP/dITP diphosphohydrolase